MFLVEVYLPTFDNDGARFTHEEFGRVRHELAERFGGVTAFTRSPAIGLWSDDSGQVHRDEIVTFEVMCESLDRDWWREYRAELGRRFRQQEVVVRAIAFERL